MRRRRPVPRTALTIAVGLLAAGIALVVGATGLLDDLELQTVDKRFDIRGTQPPPKGVVVVGIDDQSLADIGLRTPYPRSLHAKVIDNQDVTRLDTLRQRLPKRQTAQGLWDFLRIVPRLRAKRHTPTNPNRR